HNFFVNRLLLPSLRRPESKTAAVRDAYLRPFPTPASRMGTYVFPREINNATAWLMSIQAKLNTLADVPVELVMGMKDVLLASETFISRWQQIFPNAALDRVEDAGHFFQEDAPDRVAAAVQRIVERLP
ncbi:MAG: alpha/beta hydrolase, partial [Chloroflexi bacterium]|nr:alpha/beta hydrolase [Chloroflexota bacterium]